MKTSNIYFSTVYYIGYSSKHRYTAVQFLSDFNDFLTTCSEDIHLITGDFNIHYEDTKRLETKELVKILSQHDFTQLIACPTHKNQGTLDLIMINRRGKNSINNKIVHKGLLNDFSDHYSINFNMNMKIEKTPEKLVMYSRNLKMLDINMYQECLANHFTKIDVVSMSLALCINEYNYGIKTSLNEISPLVKRILKYRPYQCWFNDKVRELKKKKRKLKRKFEKNSNNQNYAEYKKQKLLYCSSPKQTRTAYYSGILQESEKNSKIMYNTIQMLSCDNKEKLLPSGFCVKDLVELFSDYFHKKIVSIRSNLNTNSQQETLINDKQSRVLVCDQMEELFT